MLNPADEKFAAKLRSILPEKAFKDMASHYREEPRGRWTSNSDIVVAPGSTAEVAELVKACNFAKVGIVPFSGGTGLVGGQIQESGPPSVVLSLERMDAIRDVSAQENVLIAEAGAILENVQHAAEKANRLFPLSLASQGSCRIGGNLATNAGGVNVLRYGNARDLCLGLEAVLPNGEILSGLSRLRKDNTGYDLRHLVIGAEGTLGIITAASLKLFARPAAEGTAFFVVPDPKAALDLLGLAQEMLGNQVSAFELIHKTGLDFLQEVGPETKLPFQEKPEWMVLIDIGVAKGLAPDKLLENLFAEAHERGLVDDGTIAQSLAHRQEFWLVRENIPEANRLIGPVSSHDISMPLSVMPKFIARCGQLIAKIDTFRINCFGHVGDGNLHYNVFPAPGKRRADHVHQRDEIKTVVHDLTHELGGSVSAEHGIGRLKIGDLKKYSDPTKLQTMQIIKAALDPNGIMNPGAVLPKAVS